jgi:hypothetical protein
VMALWSTIVAVALASAAIRAFGPILVGGRKLPPSANAVIALLAPALLAALVITQTFGQDGRLVLNEKAIGGGRRGGRAGASGAGAARGWPLSGRHRTGQDLRLANRQESRCRQEDRHLKLALRYLRILVQQGTENQLGVFSTLEV